MTKKDTHKTRPTVVILLSDKRSGSTIFQTELLGHPAVNGLAYSSHTYLESHHWLKAAVMTDQPPVMFAGGRTYPGYGGKRNARTYMIDTLCGNLPEFRPPALDRGLIFQGWEALCQHHAQPVFFEKSPQVLANWAALSMLLEWMEQTSFEVKLIGLVRNPLAVQHSSKLLFGTPPEGRQFGWAELHRNLLALRSMVSEEQLMIVRHEDILSNPVHSFADICRFVGIDPVSEMGQKISGRTQDRWRSDSEFNLKLSPATVQIARSLGYKDNELINPNATASKSSTPLFKLPSFRQTKNRLRDRAIKPFLMRRRSRFE